MEGNFQQCFLMAAATQAGPIGFKSRFRDVSQAQGRLATHCLHTPGRWLSVASGLCLAVNNHFANKGP